ncbi:MAG TPA: MraY family glycosyltransferase [Dehalococcoidia bacterium]|nr:MraY family glycosyltransferase [Dehalococcoidia bacterium]
MDPYVAALAAGFLVALACSASLVQVMPRLPASWPLGGLRSAPGRGAQVGGFAVLAAFAAAPFIAAALSDKAAEYFNPKRAEFLGYLGAVSLVFATGVVDDWRAIRPWQKLAGQLVAGSAVFAAGYRFEAIGFPWGGALDLGLLALPATLLWVVFFTNAMNLIDGKDGVATGVSVFAAAAIAAVAADTGHPAVALLCVALAGAGLGFLPLNLPSAPLILGDAGAQAFGFVLATLSIRGATGIEESVFVAVPVLALGFPVLDTLLAATRRVLEGRKPWSGDTDHIHHRLEQLELGPRGVLVALYTLSALFAAAALGTHYADSLLAEAAIFLALAVLVALVLGKLGYLVSMWRSRRLAGVRRRLAGE